MSGGRDKPALRRLLLQLAGTACPPSPDALAALDEADWQALDLLAAEHRMQPLLHAAHRDNPHVPEPMRAIWRTAHREAALDAVSARADLLETVALLRANGIEPLAMKGAWLSWHAYPAPALRPMRDVDLLVAPEHFLAAVDLLLAQGWPMAEEPEMSLADIVRHDKSPPPIIARRGTGIELHLRAWFPEGKLDYPSPAPDDAGMFARSRCEADGVRYPGGQDMLAHLVIHAVYSHRLDCGPLLLSDIDYLLQREAIDWPAFWARADAQGWSGGARLVLELVRRWRDPPQLDLSGAPGGPPPAALIESAPDLLLQDLSTRYSAGFAAAVLTGGPRVLLRRLTGRSAGVGEGAQPERNMAREGGFVSWAVSRLRRTAGEVASSDVRRQATDLARLSRWLGGGPR